MHGGTSRHESMKCKFCSKSFDNLDVLLAHVMFDHEEHFNTNVKKSNGLYLPPEFLFQNGFIDEVFDQYSSENQCESKDTNISEYYS